ncbi:putative nucleic acid-binding, replication factor A [Helianthus annuus]|nr:putative nucleic acid-binding, replication factor A [Helianthus annuus]
MEQPAITLLNNVDLNVDDYTIRIRIVRLWTRPTFYNPRKIYYYDMIFMDQEAFVLQKNTTGYEHLLKENQCLTIRNPSRGENRQKVKYVHSSLKINLNDNTTVEECNEPVGAEWGFDFSPFDSVVDDPHDDGKSFKSPIGTLFLNFFFNFINLILYIICNINFIILYSFDVIGFVVKCLPSEDKSEHNNGKDEKKTTFILEDLHFLAQLTVSTSSGYSGLSSSAIKSTTEEYLSNVSFSTIGALSEISENVINYHICIQQKFVIILGTIKSFASEESWFYNACKSCNKKVLYNTICKDKQDGSEGYDEVTVLECQTDRCNKRTVVSVPRIKVQIRVQDCIGIVTLTLFEREVLKLLKVNANQLLDKNIELASDSDGNFPKELKALLNRRFAFKITIGSFNIKNKSDGYSVSKLTENPSIIADLDRHFDDFQPADDEPLNAVPSDSNATGNFDVKDYVSRTGDEDTPVSDVNKSMFSTPSGAEMNCSVEMVENQLKRNLDAVYDVDLCSSQSSTKPRKSDGDKDEDVNVNAGLLKLKIEK